MAKQYQPGVCVSDHEQVSSHTVEFHRPSRSRRGLHLYAFRLVLPVFFRPTIHAQTVRLITPYLIFVCCKLDSVQRM